MEAYGGDCEEMVIKCINENGPAYLCDKSARSVKDYVLYQVSNQFFTAMSCNIFTCSSVREQVGATTIDSPVWITRNIWISRLRNSSKN